MCSGDGGSAAHDRRQAPQLKRHRLPDTTTLPLNVVGNFRLQGTTPLCRGSSISNADGMEIFCCVADNLNEKVARNRIWLIQRTWHWHGLAQLFITAIYIGEALQRIPDIEKVLKQPRRDSAQACTVRSCQIFGKRHLLTSPEAHFQQISCFPA